MTANGALTVDVRRRWRKATLSAPMVKDKEERSKMQVYVFSGTAGFTGEL